MYISEVFPAYHTGIYEVLGVLRSTACCSLYMYVTQYILIVPTCCALLLILLLNINL